jgi:oxygen-dependent protoporphyrinogen oxidase
MEQLPRSIHDQIPATLHFNQEVKGIEFRREQVVVRTQDQQHVADGLFCALPVREVGQLLQPHVPGISGELLKIHSEGIVVVNFGYDANVLPVQGFGYLTPTYANEDILGCVFDSSIFPVHNQKRQETRLTIKMEDTGRSEQKHIEAAMRGIRRHLGISQVPKAVHFKCAQRAIPQYGVGHLEKMAGIKKQLQDKLPQCHFLGNYLQGVSVDACIARAKEAVEEWGRSG